MKHPLRLAALLCVLLASGAWGPWNNGTSWNPFDSWRKATDVTPPATILFDHSPGVSTTSPHKMPSAVVTHDVAATCTASLSGAAWQCVTGAAAPITVTAGTGTAVANPWAQPAIGIFSDANAPSILSANLGALAGVLAAPHTIIVTGYGTLNPSSDEYLLKHGVSSSTGLDMRSESGVTKCIYANGAATPTSITASSTDPGVINGYSISTCRKALTGAASVYTSRTNGTSVDSANWDFDPASATASTLFFARHSSANFYINGQLESVTIYSAALSDAELASIEAGWMGTQPTTSQSGDAITFSRGGVAWIADAAGFYLPVGVNVPRINASGAYIEEHSNEVGAGANWATDNLAAGGWTAVGTPTTTNNQDSGPFSRWKNTAEADLIEDDSAVALEGYTAPTSCGAATDRYTISCFLKAGTAGVTTTKARLGWSTDGTGSAVCDKTITGSWARYSCSSTITSPTSTKGQILVGNDVADTGSILVSQCQCDRDGWANSPHVSNTGVGVDDMHADGTEVALWSTTGGSYQAVFKPDFTWATDLNGSDDSYEPMDLWNVGQTDHRVLAWQYYNDKPAIATRGSGQPTTDTDTYATTDPSVVAGTTYAFRVAWRDIGGGRVYHYVYYDVCSNPDTCIATTLIGSDTTGAKYAPTNPMGGWQIGCRYSRTLCMEGKILRATVWNRAF